MILVVYNQRTDSIGLLEPCPGGWLLSYDGIAWVVVTFKVTAKRIKALHCDNVIIGELNEKKDRCIKAGNGHAETVQQGQES